MALSADSLVTLAEAKAAIPVTGSGADDLIEREIKHWSREVRRITGRRWVYWAPPEVDGAANIVASVAITSATLTLAAQPDSSGRTLIVTVTDANRSITAGTITIVGTVAGATKTVVLTLSQDGPTVFHVPYFFTALASITVASLAGNTGADFIKVGTSLGLVEFYSPRLNDRTPHKLHLREYPLIQSAVVNEDTARAYGTDTALVLDTDYEVSRGEYLVRIASRLPLSWVSGYRTVKHRYSAGYFGPANVPGNIKEVVLELVAWAYRYAKNGRQGASAGTDALGSWTMGPPMVTTGMQARLMGDASWRFDELPEWDFDQDAA